MSPLWHRSLLPPPISSPAPPSLSGTAPPSPVSSLFPSIPPTPWHRPSPSTLLAPISSPLSSTGPLQPSVPSGTVRLNRAEHKLFGRTDGCLAERRPSVRPPFGPIWSVRPCLAKRRPSVRPPFGPVWSNEGLLFGLAYQAEQNDLCSAKQDRTETLCWPCLIERCRRKSQYRER